MMNLDEAISHAREKAEENKKAASRFAYPDKAGTTKESADCLECAKEHEQLAEWLKDYKRLLEKRPQGEWKIYMSGHQGEKTTSITYKCSCCGRRIVYVASDYKSKEEFLSDYPFCHCGADMRGKEE